MLAFNFTRIFKARGIEKPFTYLVKRGFSETFATRMVHNRVKRMNLDDVERFCELFQCTPNDLLEWIPGDAEGNDTHPLLPLKRSDAAINITKMLSSVPLDKLADIENLIKKELGK